VVSTVGVVIPTLNEAAYLPGILNDVAHLAVPHEVVVADGGSHDDTLTVAREAGARVVVASRGRGTQLNAGAAAVESDWLCFLHADVRMPRSARAELERTVADTAVQVAVWGLRIDAGGFWPRFMELGNALRDRIRTLRRRARIERLGAALGVSPRRWLREGPYRTWIRNSLLLSAYLAGASPQRLVRWYRPETP
jgi:glycosyltransferase involved in cell wall biosynthesis